MIKAHKIRLNPTPTQETYFYRSSGVARTGWNWALEEYKRRKAAGHEIDWNEIKKEFRARIETEFPFVHEVTKCAAEADMSRTIFSCQIVNGSVQIVASTMIGTRTERSISKWKA
jgi:Helix-turn-helix domain